MQKGFSLINIFLIIGIIALVYIGYNNYYLKKDTAVESGTPELSQEEKTAAVPENNGENANANEIPAQPVENPAPKNEPTSEEIIQPKQEGFLPEPIPTPAPEPETPTTDNGYYENSTYKYAITAPADWPLKVREESNISIGTVPPKNGQGAITIEVGGKSLDQEIEQAEAEAKKYPGLVEITKEPITLAGLTGEKMILNNSVVNKKNIYILLEKGDSYYSIKYSEESERFAGQAEAAVKTFKFTK